MTEPAPKTWSQLLRQFAAFGLPMMLLLLIVVATPKEIGEPAFMQSWSVEAKAFSLFALVIVLFALLPVVWDLWARWIDPTTTTDALGRKPIERFIDNVGMHVAMAAVVAFATYAKDLKHISVWWMGLAIFVAGLLPLLASIYRQMKRGGGKP